MSSRQSQILRSFLRVQRLAQRNASIDFVRRLSRWTERLYSVPEDVRWEKFIRNEQTYEWLIPERIGSEQVIFYIHGGGFSLPLYNPTRHVVSYLAKMAEMRALLFSYRLAPEHPFPAAIEDCVKAYHWLISEGGVLPEEVIFAGESAGGNLVMTTMLSLRDTDPLPGRAVVIGPGVDFEGGGTFYTQDDPMSDANFVMRFLNAYRGSADPRDPLLSPLYADLRGLPPLLIQIGSDEILRSGGEGLALRAKQAGILTTLEIWDGMWHYWHLFIPFLPEAQQAMQNIVQFIHSEKQKAG